MKAAGIFFKSQGFFLAGRSRKDGLWTGFGGTAKAGEAPLRAAIRRVLRDIFGIENATLCDELAARFHLEKVYSREEYTLYVAPLGLLFEIASILKTRGIASRNFGDHLGSSALISYFKPVHSKMSSIKLFRVARGTEAREVFKGAARPDPYFIQDLELLFP